MWINQGDIILLGLRDYQDSKADVILRYSAEEARVLKNKGHLPANTRINETETYGGENDEGGVIFDESHQGWREEEQESGSGSEEDSDSDLDVDDI